MKTLFNCGKLLVCMIGRNRGDQLVAVTKSAGARGGTIILGRSRGDNRLLQALSLADVMQDIVFTLMRDESEAVFDAVVQAARKNPGKLGGQAMLLDVACVLNRVVQGDEENQDNKGVRMESGYQLVTVIVNSGYGDDVMEAARKAGANGGTILSARGTGTEEDVKFFGITLVPEKDMLLIATESSRVDKILEAIGKVSKLNEPGGGIVYCMNIEKFVHLGSK